MYINKTHCTNSNKITVKTTMKNYKHNQCSTGIMKPSDRRRLWTFTLYQCL